MIASSACAANPTFQSFDTNSFVANAVANNISANTNSGNPNALVTQFQLSNVGGATNGILKVNGTGTNTTLGSLTVVGGLNFDSGIFSGPLTNSSATAISMALWSVNKALVSMPNQAGLLYNSGTVPIYLTAPPIDLTFGQSGTLPISAINTNTASNGQVLTVGSDGQWHGSNSTGGLTQSQFTAGLAAGTNAGNFSSASVGSLQGVAHFGSGVLQGGVTAHAGYLQNDGTDSLIWTRDISTLTNLPISSLNTNGGSNGQIATIGANGTVQWSNAPPSGIASSNTVSAGTNIVVTTTQGASTDFKVALADPVVIGTLQVNTITTSNGIIVNAGNSNYFGGYNYFTNNSAPIAPLSTTGNGGSFTNYTSSRAILVYPYYLSTGTGGNASGSFSNRMTGKSFPIVFNVPMTLGVNVTNVCFTNVISLPPCSPGDVWDAKNNSSGNATFGLPAGPGVPNPEWYPID